MPRKPVPQPSMPEKKQKKKQSIPNTNKTSVYHQSQARFVSIPLPVNMLSTGNANECSIQEQALQRAREIGKQAALWAPILPPYEILMEVQHYNQAQLQAYHGGYEESFISGYTTPCNVSPSYPPQQTLAYYSTYPSFYAQGYDQSIHIPQPSLPIPDRSFPPVNPIIDYSELNGPFCDVCKQKFMGPSAEKSTISLEQLAYLQSLLDEPCNDTNNQFSEPQQAQPSQPITRQWEQVNPALFSLASDANNSVSSSFPSKLSPR